MRSDGNRAAVATTSTPDALSAIDIVQFRDRLDNCLPPPDAARFMMRLANELPLSSRLQHQLAYGALAGLGALEIQPAIHLRYVRPASTGGVSIARFRAEPDGTLRRVQGPSSDLDEFIARYRQFRLLFLTISGVQNHREILVGGTSREELKRTTTACMENATAVGCFPLMKGAVIAPELSVTVNGAQIFVPWNATLREATRGQPPVSVRRGPRRLPLRWEAGATPLGLTLLGGEVIETK